MEKIWVKFTSDYTQKSKTDGVKDISFKVGDIVELDATIAKALVTAGLCETTEEPKGDDNLKTQFEDFTKSLVTTVQETVTNVFSEATKSLGDGVKTVFATAKDHEKEGLRGFEDENHFYKSIINAGMDGSQPFNVGTGLELLTKAPTGQNISNDTEGNFAVPETIASAIWDNIENDPVSPLGMTDRYQTGGNSIKIPRMFESSRKQGAGQRYAGITTTWLDEADEIQATKGTMGKMSMELHKLGAVIYFTEEQLDDAAPSFNNRMRQNVPKAINFAVMESFFNGTGVGKPKGIFNSDSMIVVAKESGQGANTIFHKNVNNMYWRNWNRSNAVWYCHPDLAQQLEFMSFNDDTTNQRPVYLPANQVVSGPFGLLYGRPVVPLEFMSVFGSQGDLAFLDWSQYATLTKIGGGVKSAASIHVRFLYEETAFRFTFRIDGRELWTSPKTDLNGTNTRSPFVVMGERDSAETSSGI